MGIDDGVPIHTSLAKIQLRGTDRLHRTDEHENVDIDRKEAQRRSHQVEQHTEKSGESEGWTDDPYGH